MPPKQKGASKARQGDSKQQPKQEEAPKKPQTLFEWVFETWSAENPFWDVAERHEIDTLSAKEQRIYWNSQILKSGGYKRMGKKASKEFWKQVNEANIPFPKGLRNKPKIEDWGKDKNGRNFGDYTREEYGDKIWKDTRLVILGRESRRFRDARDLALKQKKENHPLSILKAYSEYSEEGAIEVEIERRKEMASIRRELYGEKENPYAIDPAWDDVVPIPQSEPEGALAAIAYPEDYAESMSYLRAVMAAQEYSPRTLKLTEHIISMNPAHYTVWLYRFSIIQYLNIPIPDELAWLNEVALENQKNYQIWHHRQLLTDHFYSTIADTPGEVKRFANNERDFLMQMFAEDAKNYHVWSYRQYLVRKLAMWDQDELESIEGMIKEDVRNNSAWSHRFFLVFSNPENTTPDSHATVHDPAVPAEIVEREISYAEEMIKLAPQNQSPWNYLRGVLVKGGRKLGNIREFAEDYVQDLGGETEDVQSTHALDQLADIYKEAGEMEKADLCLRRLGEKWDRIRVGYWEWKRKNITLPL